MTPGIGSTVNKISVVNPDDGSAEGIDTLVNPVYLGIHGSYLFVTSQNTPEVEILTLPDLENRHRLKLGSPAIVPPIVR